MSDIELHPGVRVALARGRMNETQVARAIAAGELTSPQQFANSWYFDLRITGTGAAYRAALKEYVWRDPSLYLNQEFLDRCSGLPVILEHPKGEMLNSKEYARRNVGTVVVPYIKGDEVWGVARILDQATAEYMRDHDTSTSPAVVFTESANETIEAKDGKHLLIEGVPSLMDHLAICEEGVWDKGGPPAGVDSSGASKEAKVADETEAEREAREEKEREDAQKRADAAAGEKLDKLLEGIKVLSDRMDSIEKSRKDENGDEHPPGCRCDSCHKDAKGGRKDESAETEERQAAELARLAAEEAESGKKKEERADAEEGTMPWDDLERKDGEGDKEFSERVDKAAAKHDASYRKRDDESLAAHCDRASAGFRKDRAKRADRARMDSVDTLLDTVAGLTQRIERLQKETATRTVADENAFADVQARADSVYQAHGDPAPRPMSGESLVGYRIRLLRGLQGHSPAWKDSDVGQLARLDSAAFSNVEALVYADAAKAAQVPTTAGVGKLREIKERLPGGHLSSRFVGDPLAWMVTFMPPGRTTTRLRAPDRR